MTSSFFVPPASPIRLLTKRYEKSVGVDLSLVPRPLVMASPCLPGLATLLPTEICQHHICGILPQATCPFDMNCHIHDERPPLPCTSTDVAELPDSNASSTKRQVTPSCVFTFSSPAWRRNWMKGYAKINKIFVFFVFNTKKFCINFLFFCSWKISKQQKQQGTTGNNIITYRVHNLLYVILLVE